MDYTIAGFNFSEWEFDAYYLAQDEVQFILDKSEILKFNESEKKSYLKDQQKLLAEQIGDFPLGKIHSTLIMEYLHFPKFDKFLYLRITKMITRSPYNTDQVEQMIRELFKVVKILFTIDGIAQYLKEPNTNSNKKEPLTYIGLFNNAEHADKVKQIFASNGFTSKNKWVGESFNKSELLAAFHVLKRKNIFKNHKITAAVKIFYSEFGVQVGTYISDRATRNEPSPKDIMTLERLFSDIKS